ncbi:MAG: hypothetical protein AB1916_09670 [Thermodesulfobacteriota bacterium]
MTHGPAPDRSEPAGRLAACEKDRAGAVFLLETLLELVRVGESLLEPEAFLERCGCILRRRLDADIAVCRLREKAGEGDAVWRNVAVDTRDNQPTPLFVRDLVETLPRHPVMRAVREDPERMTVITDLTARPARPEGPEGPDGPEGPEGPDGPVQSEDECEEFDLAPCRAGFRTRLSFILRSAGQRPFGIIMLYAREARFFDRLDPRLLAECAQVVSLIAGRMLALGRDALAKAAGGMAHVGNNVLATLEGRVDLVLNELEDIFGPDGDSGGAGRQGLLAQVRAMQGDIARLARAITRLEQAVERPVLMHYALGRHVLDLEPERSGRGRKD